MAGRYEVFPDGEEWNFLFRSEEGKAEKNKGTFSTRSEAIAAAREKRGDVREEHFRKDGSLVGEVLLSRGPEAIYLMRPDGSIYGELDHEVRDGGEPQRISLDPASATEVAANG